MAIIDYPKETLPPEIWNFRDHEIDREPLLKKDVETEIIKRVNTFLMSEDMSPSIVKAILIGASTATHFYKVPGDLDIKLYIDTSKYNFQDNFQRDAFFEDLIKSIREHEISSNELQSAEGFTPDFYFYDYKDLADVDLNRYDSLYDVMNREWLKPPVAPEPSKKTSVDRFPLGAKMADNWAQSIDGLRGDLNRDTVEYEYLRDSLDYMDDEDREIMEKHLKKMLKGIENDVNVLVKKYNEIRDARHKVFDETKELPEYIESINWLPENVAFKFLQRWKYLKLLRDIKEFLDDDNKITTDEVDDIQDVVSTEINNIPEAFSHVK